MVRRGMLAMVHVGGCLAKSTFPGSSRAFLLSSRKNVLAVGSRHRRRMDLRLPRRTGGDGAEMKKADIIAGRTAGGCFRLASKSIHSITVEGLAGLQGPPKATWNNRDTRLSNGRDGGYWLPGRQ